MLSQAKQKYEFVFNGGSGSHQDIYKVKQANTVGVFRLL